MKIDPVGPGRTKRLPWFLLPVWLAALVWFFQQLVRAGGIVQ